MRPRGRRGASRHVRSGRGRQRPRLREAHSACTHLAQTNKPRLTSSRVPRRIARHVLNHDVLCAIHRCRDRMCTHLFDMAGPQRRRMCACLMCVHDQRAGLYPERGSTVPRGRMPSCARARQLRCHSASSSSRAQHVPPQMRPQRRHHRLCGCRSGAGERAMDLGTLTPEGPKADKQPVMLLSRA
jgi:hypothetical protein